MVSTPFTCPLLDPAWDTQLTPSPLARALTCGYLTQDMIDDYEPALMFTIPRLAIVW